MQSLSSVVAYAYAVYAWPRIDMGAKCASNRAVAVAVHCNFLGDGIAGRGSIPIGILGYCSCGGPRAGKDIAKCCKLRYFILAFSVN